MAYEKTNWTTGDVITAEKMNKIEAGIEGAASGGSGGFNMGEIIGTVLGINGRLPFSPIPKMISLPSDGILDLRGFPKPTFPNIPLYICDKPVKKLCLDFLTDTSGSHTPVIFVPDINFEGAYSYEEYQGEYRERKIEQVNDCSGDASPRYTNVSINEILIPDGKSIYLLLNPGAPDGTLINAQLSKLTPDAA